MGLKRSFVANVISKKFGSIQPPLRAVGTTFADMIRADMDPSASDLGGKAGAIKKLNKCTFSWYPQEAAPKNAKLFRDAKKAGEELYQFILMMSVEGYPEERLYFKGTKVKNVHVDARNGEEVVELTLKSAAPKPD